MRSGLFLIGVQYREQKAHNAGAPIGNSNRSFQSGKNYLIEKNRNPTSHRIGLEHGVSEKAVREAAKYADAVDAIATEYGYDARHALVTKGKAGESDVLKIADARR